MEGYFLVDNGRLIKCADCGGWYGSKVWHSTDRYRKVIYRCNRKYNGDKCQTPHVTEDEVKAAFVSAYNQLVTEKKEIIANAEIIRRTEPSPILTAAFGGGMVEFVTVARDKQITVTFRDGTEILA